MQRHFTIELLGIKDKHVDVWDVTEESSSLIVELYTKQKQEKCPFCKEKTNRVHSYRRQEIQGPVLSNKDVKISLKKRRYLCPNCSRPFYERLQMADYYQRCTNALLRKNGENNSISIHGLPFFSYCSSLGRDDKEQSFDYLTIRSQKGSRLK
ncbi:transposase family protein [Amphibacillus jilinensis]|uniref:transposase family protein n=1 Tax=Amphibacillus jilinensis TaxID=1216008 RepID=UPI000379B65A|nr:transposase family protein [Amphibacillus jilinensis]